MPKPQFHLKTIIQWWISTDISKGLLNICVPKRSSNVGKFALVEAFFGTRFSQSKCKQHKLVTTSAYHEGFIVALRGRHRRVTRNKENNIG